MDLNGTETALQQVIAQLARASTKGTRDNSDHTGHESSSSRQKTKGTPGKQQRSSQQSNSPTSTATVAENAALRLRLARADRELAKTLKKPEAPQKTDYQVSRDLEALRQSLKSDWPLDDGEVQQLAAQLRADIQQFAHQFFGTDAPRLEVPYMYRLGVDLPESLQRFLAYLGPGISGKKGVYVGMIQDPEMRSRVMQAFIWRYLVRKVFRHFLWLGKQVRAYNARQIADSIDPSKHECKDMKNVHNCCPALMSAGRGLISRMLIK